MLKTLAWKEMRELVPLGVLALLVESCLLVTARAPLIPRIYGGGVIPFYNDPICNLMLIVAGFAAAAFGLQQTTRESSRGTFQFLLHRPAARDALFGTKLLVGLVIYVFAAGLPLGAYTLWAATPGTHASPFLWSLAGGVWLAWAMLPLLYLGGFLSGLRPGRWFGTRLLPLAGSLLVILATQFFDVATWIGLALCVIAGTALFLAIMYVADTRDYS